METAVHLSPGDRNEPSGIQIVLNEAGVEIARVEAYYGSPRVLSEFLESEYAHGLAALVEAEARGPIGVLYGLDVVEGSRRRGLGSFLVKEALDLLRKAKVRLVWIQASSELGTPEEVLIAFYEGLGFNLCCRTEDASNDPALSLDLKKQKLKS